MTEPSIDLRCPKCGQIDQVQKVSAVYTAGLTTGTSIGATVGVAGRSISDTALGIAKHEMKSRGQSLQSQLLAPPPRPESHNPPGAILLLGILMLIGGPFALLSAAAASPLNTEGLVVGAALVLLGTGLVAGNRLDAKRTAARQQTELPAWEHNMSIWSSLYYCGRDDGVFDPTDRVFVPLSQLTDYIDRRVAK